MTEREAIEELKYDCNELGKAIPCDTSWGSSFENAYGMAIQALEKLAEYKDLEKRGRLIKLPCKVGDTVWDIDYGIHFACTITAFSFGECEEYICDPVTTKEVVFYYASSSGSITGSFAESAIGESVFLNKSEAEAKLKELGGGENVKTS